MTGVERCRSLICRFNEKRLTTGEHNAITQQATWSATRYHRCDGWIGRLHVTLFFAPETTTGHPRGAVFMLP